MKNLFFFTTLVIIGCSPIKQPGISIEIHKNKELVLTNKTGKNIIFVSPVRIQLNPNFKAYILPPSNSNIFIIHILDNAGVEYFPCGFVHYWGKEITIDLPNNEPFIVQKFKEGPPLRELYCLKPGVYKIHVNLVKITGNDDQSLKDESTFKVLYRSNSIPIRID